MEGLEGLEVDFFRCGETEGFSLASCFFSSMSRGLLKMSVQDVK